jgi:hypothetical protein
LSPDAANVISQNVAGRVAWQLLVPSLAVTTPPVAVPVPGATTDTVNVTRADAELGGETLVMLVVVLAF